MKYTTINRDPFARFDIIRRKAEGECAWCGHKAKWNYGAYADGIYTRPEFQPKNFCSIGCMRAYYQEA